MSDKGDAATMARHGNPAVLTRLVGWAIIGSLAAFLVNNVLIQGFGLGSAASVFSGNFSGVVPLLAYVVAIGAAIYYVSRSVDTSLRWDAQRIHRINCFIIRGCYFAILLVGLFDITISFMRVENIFSLFLSEHWVLNFERPDFVGIYVHFPLIILGFVIAIFSRSLGFIWLALAIIIAELSIVITRFVFSYEQAFMGDLVRYWYSALFLLASAYTLFEEGHVRVDVVYSNFGPRAKGVVNVVGIFLLGMPTCAAILAVGFSGTQSIINGPVMHFEITQTGSIGLFVKYQMAAFLGIFAATMLIQFVSMLFDSVADKRGEPGHRTADVLVP